MQGELHGSLPEEISEIVHTPHSTLDVHVIAIEAR